MNREELRALTTLVLNHNSAQVGQDFTDANINTALDEAYNDEVNRAINNGMRRFFERVEDFVWPANQVQLELPKMLQSKPLVSLYDVTNDSLGSELLIDGCHTSSTVFFYNKNTLQWGTQGPPSAKTLRAVYLNTALPLRKDTDEPDVLPSQYHSLLAWAAGSWLKRLAEEQAPNQWEAYIEMRRQDLYKYLSVGRPISDTPRIEALNPVSSDTYY